MKVYVLTMLGSILGVYSSRKKAEDRRAELNLSVAWSVTEFNVDAK